MHFWCFVKLYNQTLLVSLHYESKSLLESLQIFVCLIDAETVDILFGLQFSKSKVNYFLPLLHIGPVPVSTFHLHFNQREKKNTLKQFIVIIVNSNNTLIMVVFIKFENGEYIFFHAQQCCLKEMNVWGEKVGMRRAFEADLVDSCVQRKQTI